MNLSLIMAVSYSKVNQEEDVLCADARGVGGCFYGSVPSVFWPVLTDPCQVMACDMRCRAQNARYSDEVMKHVIAYSNVPCLRRFAGCAMD